MPTTDGHYSELMVLQSAAGWYIGTLYSGPDGYVEPGSRDSSYFGTRDEADAALLRNLDS